MTNLGQAGKQKKLELVYRVVQRYPNGIGEREIADELNLERRTVNNYLRDLEMEGKIYKELYFRSFDGLVTLT